MVEVLKNWDGVEGMHLYVFKSKSGLLKCKVTNYGATLVSLQVRGKDGNFDETTLGYDTAQQWQEGRCYFGCTVGRFGNRIKEGKFKIDDTGYKLDHCNNGNNHLHGGENGFDKRIWDAEVVDNAETDVRGVKMTLSSRDGDNGYPGNLKVESWILLDGNDELCFSWKAVVEEKKTIVNLTNHAYWNLGAWTRSEVKDVLAHRLTLKADRYVEVDGESIPTGKLPSVEGNVFDFREGRTIGDGVEDKLIAPQLGYDHTLVFAEYTPVTEASSPALLEGGWSAKVPCKGELFAPSTKYGFTLHTTEPGVQVYCGNYLDPKTLKGYSSVPISHRGGLCLECQHFPDSPNQPSFPSTVLSPGETYLHTTVHKFFVRE